MYRLTLEASLEAAGIGGSFRNAERVKREKSLQSQPAK
jgi:hypothetical protein